MKRALTIIAILIALGSVGIWTTLGANRGWTKTQAAVKSVDDVTGIEGISYQKRFQPGLDFLAAGLLVAGGIAGVSVFVRSKSN